MASRPRSGKNISRHRLTPRGHCHAEQASTDSWDGASGRTLPGRRFEQHVLVLRPLSPARLARHQRRPGWSTCWAMGSTARCARASARFVSGGQRLADVPEVLCASPDSLAAHGTLHDPCWPAGRSCWRRGGGQICRWRCIRSPGIWRLECARSWIGRRAFRGAV